ncbi:MAG TPA: hypothetical protein VHU83_11715 [Bryobacteraceae bacterium]|jgi:hypothetical protein|nr:hypothetical protein [Bryobacteraceae bacterium]
MTNSNWHPAVRRRYNELLIFFRASVQPFSSITIRNKLSDLSRREKTQSLKADMLFGRHDLLLRLWMHSQVIPDFRYKLAEALNTDTTPQSFVVNEVYTATPKVPEAGHQIWQTVLDPHKVRAIQSDTERSDLAAELVEQNLIIPLRKSGTEFIKFYTAVSLSSEEKTGVLTQKAIEIYQELLKRNTVHYPAVYQGDGFCTILVEGSIRSEHYFNVGSFLDWLLDNIGAHRATTETYLVANAEPFFAGPEQIDDRTFIERRGRDGFIDEFLPEVNEDLSYRSEDVSHFVRTRVQNVLSTSHLPRGTRSLIADYLKGYVRSEPSKSGVALLIFFAELEGFLRKTYPIFLGKKSLDQRTIFAAASIKKENSQYLSLGECLTIYSKAIEASPDLAHSQRLTGAWNEFVQLRNTLAHGDLDLLQWRAHVEVLLAALPRVIQLVQLIAATTGQEPRLTFLADEHGR